MQQPLSHFLSLSDLNTSSQAAYTPSTDAAILFASSNIFLLPDNASLTLLSLLLQQLYLHHWVFVYEVTAQNAGSYMGYVTSHQVLTDVSSRWMCHHFKLRTYWVEKESTGKSGTHGLRLGTNRGAETGLKFLPIRDLSAFIFRKPQLRAKNSCIECTPSLSQVQKN